MDGSGIRHDALGAAERTHSKCRPPIWRNGEMRVAQSYDGARLNSGRVHQPSRVAGGHHARQPARNHARLLVRAQRWMSARHVGGDRISFERVQFHNDDDPGKRQGRFVVAGTPLRSTRSTPSSILSRRRSRWSSPGCMRARKTSRRQFGATGGSWNSHQITVRHGSYSTRYAASSEGLVRSHPLIRSSSVCRGDVNLECRGHVLKANRSSEWHVVVRQDVAVVW